MEDAPQGPLRHNLDRRMRVYLSPKAGGGCHSGFWPYDRESATGLLHPGLARYERGSIILTSTRDSASGANCWATR